MKAQHGDTVLIYNPFKWNDWHTYVSALIRIFIKLHYNHCESIVEIDGSLYSFGALKDGYTKRTLEEMLAGKDVEDLAILRPKFTFDSYKFRSTAISFIGIKYNYIGTFFDQAILQVTNDKVWIGAKALNMACRKLYCSEACAALYFFCGVDSFKEYYRTSPKDLYLSPSFDKFELTK